MTEFERKIVEKINNDNKIVMEANGSSSTPIYLYSKEELSIWKKYNNYSNLKCAYSGELGHRFNKNFGVYTPREGYYKIVEFYNQPIFAKSGLFVDSDKYTASAQFVNTSNGDDRQIIMPIYAHYDFYFHDEYSSDIVLIDGNPLFNNASNGPKSKQKLSIGTIIHVMSTKLSENKTYAIDWRIIDEGRNFDDDNDCGDSYSQYRGYNDWDDDTINSAFDGNPSATWNVD